MKKLDRLKSILRQYRGAVVAFSGGVDSTFLLRIAKDVLEDRLIAVTAVSPLQPKSEIRNAVRIARRMKVKHVKCAIDILREKEVRTNPVNRCYHCKMTLLRKLKSIAAEHDYVVIEATNRSDLKDHRPGLDAIKRLRIKSPLMMAGFTKDDIRRAARRRGLLNWNEPSMACLASRIPYGQPITISRLRRIDNAENYLRRIGFSPVRVRDHFPTARIEVNASDFKKLISQRKKVVAYLRGSGYKHIALDLAGYRTGSLNP
ncbi:MAG: ATP-dependent sacrificial sulfur transferase LarE [candidate division WOR-3 bacterium]|nr:MAG: ATP-dependent sacrificial sulfur transferase LarE [candidate division WOR-3 bacterium]